MRWRTLVGGFAILSWICVYSAAAMIIGAEVIPDHWAAHLVYYPIAGILWIFPLRPLFRWTARDPEPENYPFE